jgi:hypothetical protein
VDTHLLKIVHLEATLLRLKVALLRAFQNQTLSFSNTTRVVFVRTVSHLEPKIALLKHRHCKNFPLLKPKAALLALLETAKRLLYKIVHFLKPKFTLLKHGKTRFCTNCLLFERKSSLFETRLRAVF